MKPMKKLFLSVQVITTLTFFMFTCFNIKAQVKTKIYEANVPENLLPTKRISSKEIILDSPDEFISLRGREKDNNDNRFAVSLATNISLIEQSEKFEDDNYTIYTLRVVAKDALNISLGFGKFHLSENAILTIYNDKEITDSITSKENNENSIWATRVYQGNYINIVLKEPLNEKEISKIEISKINFGYKKYGIQYGISGASATCEINANCPLGNGWDNEKNTVALIVANGDEWCSGSLIMNTCGTNIPYFLTANHCLQAGNEVNWVFQFQFWSATCSPNSGWNEDIQFNGCTLRANNANTDFALLELNQRPAANSGINYAGWNRNTTGITQTTILHYPAGDLMKITRDNNAPVSATFLGANCLHLVVDNGTTEGGSSGSPYFDQNHRVIGQHYGIDDGNLAICNQVSKYGGRFDLSWTGGGTNSTRLSNWLDPNNSDALNTNTTNIASLFPNIALSISGSNSICTTNSTATYALNNAPAGSTVTWSVTGVPYNTAVSITSTTSNTCTIQRNGDANSLVTVTASVTVNGCYTTTVTKKVNFGHPVFFWVDPPINQAVESGDFECSGGSNAQCYSASPIGKKIWFTSNITNYTSINWTKNWSIPASPDGSIIWSNDASGNRNEVSVHFKSANKSLSLKTTLSNTCGTNERYFCFHSTNVACSSGLLLSETEIDLSLIVYPNPVENKNVIALELYINDEAFTFKDAVIRLVDSKNNIILEKQGCDVLKEQLQLPYLSNGTYYVNVSNLYGIVGEELIINRN